MTSQATTIAQGLTALAEMVGGGGAKTEQSAGSDATAKPDASPSTGETDAQTVANMSAAAMERYRSTMKWSVGAFVSVAGVVLATLPFAGADEAGRNAWMITAGLVFVAVGVALSISAVSKVNEPLQISLAALISDLDAVDTTNKQQQRKRYWLQPRKQALRDLKLTLVNPPGKDIGAGNHLGPAYWDAAAGSAPVASDQPSELVAAIGTTDLEYFRQAHDVALTERDYRAQQWRVQQLTDSAEIAWTRYREVATHDESDADPPRSGGDTSPSSGETPPAAHVSQISFRSAPRARPSSITRLRQVVRTAARAPTAARRSATHSARGSATGPAKTSTSDPSKTDAWNGDAIEALCWSAYWTTQNELVTERSALESKRSSFDAAARQLSGTVSRLDTHHARRFNVLHESATMRMRGVFREARQALMVGALATALGIALYFLGLPTNSDESTEDLATGGAVVRFFEGVEAPEDGTPVTVQLVGVQAACAQQDLEGVLVDAVADPSVVVVTDGGECAGAWVLPAGSWIDVSGALTLSSESGETASAASDDDAGPATTNGDPTPTDAPTPTEG